MKANKNVESRIQKAEGSQFENIDNLMGSEKKVRQNGEDSGF